MKENIKESITKKFYDKDSKIYDKKRFTTPHGKYINEREQEVIINELVGNDVLELCCGTGRFGKLITKRNFNYTGIDFSEKMIEKAGKKNKGNNAKFIVLNVTNLSRLPKESFDSIFVSRALKFWSDPQQVMNDCYNLLRPFGRLIVHFASNDFFPHWLLYFTGNTLGLRKYQNRLMMLRVQEVGTERRYFISEVVRMMRKAGFKGIYWKSHFNFMFYSLIKSEFITKIIRKLDNHFNFGQKSIIVGLKR